MNLVNNISNKFKARLFTIPDMEQTQERTERLGDYVARIIREKGLTYRDVAERAAKKGFTISYSYVGHIVNNFKQGLTQEKMRALAEGLGVPLAELYKAANLDFKESEYGERAKLLVDSLDKEMQPFALEFLEFFKLRFPTHRRHADNDEITIPINRLSVTAKDNEQQTEKESAA